MNVPIDFAFIGSGLWVNFMREILSIWIYTMLDTKADMKISGKGNP